MTTTSSASQQARVPLSVLELVPRSQGMTQADALRESTELARLVDRLGYERLWVAEHHNTEAFMSSATSLILGHFAEHTSRIRLGSGGVMLPNHAPLMVAEYYGTLATLHGDRFDLGLGRAPGTDPMTAAALQRGDGQLDRFAQDVLDLVDYLGEPDQGRRVRAIPGEGTRVPLWMLGSSTGGAQVAAALGLPFSFASHFAPQQIREAIAIYRDRFRADVPTAQVDRPTVMAGINVLVAPTDVEAEYLFTTARQMAARIRSGRPGPLDPPVDDIRAVVPEELLALTAEHHAVSAVGTQEQVVARMQAFVDAYALDELIVTTYTYDPAMRRRSFELLAQAWGMPGE
ncbi:LLM class flavin-dependent oxidoreductase [Ornithinicoccus halotolerans]|uniref:LLM class flavin-dependent oxidoreductase n=1 Tax=Ornithinicoccus halotolerans TaxID=1748220 RepID=UPI001294D59B|nr:LLM class flavin-dependent oxidoreductase [Ornithinicoccus halotolerans]